MSTEKAVTTIGERGAEFKTTADLANFAATLQKEGMLPSGMRSAGQALIAMQTGAEVGMHPMKAVQSVVVINGMPTWKAETMRALILMAGYHINYKWSGKEMSDDWTCTAASNRYEGASASFSVAQAKRAGLWGRGNWKTYPDRMLQARAIGFLARDHFADLLAGMGVMEEQQDIALAKRAEMHAVAPGKDPLLEAAESPPIVVDAEEVSVVESEPNVQEEPPSGLWEDEAPEAVDPPPAEDDSGPVEGFDF